MPSLTLIGKVKRWSGCTVIVLPPILRNHMQLKEGDILCLRVHLPYCTFVKWPEPHVPSAREIGRADLPPRNPTELRVENTANSKAPRTD